MATLEAQAIQREQFEREQGERLGRIEGKQDEILKLLRQLSAANKPAGKTAEDDKKTADK